MKKLLYALSILLLTACSNDDVIEDQSTENKDQKYPVSFSVNNFTSEIQDLRSSYFLEESGIKSFYLLITNEDSIYVEAIEKANLSDLSSLQNIQLELPKGKYTAHAILMDNWDTEGETNLPMTGEYGYLGKHMRALDFNYINFYATTKLILDYTYTLNGKTYNFDRVFNFRTMLYDYFYKKIDFTVNESGANIKETLPRVNGKVEFHFTDIKPLDNSVYPEDMYYAYVHMSGFSGVNLISGFGGVGDPGFYLTRKQWSELAEKPLSFYLRDTDNAELLIKIIDQDKPFAVMNPDSDNSRDEANLKYKYIIPNIKVVVNKKTIVTGSLDKPSGFNISVDSTWDDDTINVDL